MGQIVNTSRSISDIFGYSYEKIKGLNVNVLLPEFMREEHN
jgi:PAS domain S-box-containing protein